MIIGRLRRGRSVFTGALALSLLSLGTGAVAKGAEYALILHEESVARRPGFHKGPLTAVQSLHRDSLRSTQQSLRQELEARNFRVTGATQVLVNAVFVHTSRDRVAELRSLPGVDRVVFVPRARAKLNTAVQLIDAPAAWNFLGGIPNAGLGMKIADLDTGITPSHPAFINNALPAVSGYPLCDPADCVYTSRKIIVARSYVQSESAGSPPNPAVDSRPDDYTILDHYGHGTGVMGVAAGETNAGPAATITGIAPQAYLGIYKVGGTPGIIDGFSDAALIQALEDATADGMDIVNMSLGALPFTGALDTGAVCGIPTGEFCDPLSEAIEQATLSGVLVVVAAGNEGDIGMQFPGVPTLNTVGSPAIAPSALAVAGAENSHSFYNQVHVHGTGAPASLANASAQFGSGPIPLLAVRGALRDTTALGDALGCTALPSDSLSGAVAFIERGTCNFSAKIQNAQDAGADAAIIYDNTAEATLISMDAGNSTIPAVFISRADGTTLAAYLKQNPTGATATLDPYAITLYAAPGAKQLTSFSSRGPSINGTLKPDITAIGDNVYIPAESFDANGIYSSSGYLVAAGTSYATPMVAGAAALVKQHNPSLTPLQIKSALMNTAAQTVIDPFTSFTASVTGAGAGMLDIYAAMQANVSIVPSSVSFGFLKSGSLPINVPLRLTNTGATPVSLSIAVAATVSATNASVAVDQSAIALAPGNSTTLNVSLTGALPLPGIYEGNINIQGAAVPLHIPYLFILGDGVPFDAFALAGTGIPGTVGQSPPDGFLAATILDQYGVPVPNLPVTFSVAVGNGKLETPDPATDQYGIATAGATISKTVGDNQFQVQASGGIAVIFDTPGRLMPTISTHGATNAANSQPEAAAVPGSYVALVGTGLSDFTDSTATAALMPSIDSVSVSFDVPSAGISVPARLYYVSPGEVGIQVPWELQGQTSALIKVNIDASTGTLYTLPIAEYGPAFFIRNNLLAAEDASYHLITTASPAARGATVLLYCNGLGPVNNQPADGALASSTALSTTTTTPTVTIGGKKAQVLFSGLAPGFPGLYQINVIVPADAPTGAQPVIVTIGGVASPAATLPVM